MEPDKTKSNELCEKKVQPDRIEVIRDAFVIQLKLVVDGFRDLALLPLSFVATIWGLLRHNTNPGRYLYRLMSYGKASEQWIGLFNDASKDERGEIKLQASSLDEVFDKAQSALQSKYLDDEKKQQLLSRFNAAFDELNVKFDTKKKNS